MVLGQNIAKYLPFYWLNITNQKHMKKILIALGALAFTIQLAQAQTDKGSHTLGVNLSYNHLSGSRGSANHSSIQYNKQENWGIGISYGYFVADNWEVGISPVIIK